MCVCSVGVGVVGEGGGDDREGQLSIFTRARTQICIYAYTVHYLFYCQCILNGSYYFVHSLY